MNSSQKFRSGFLFTTPSFLIGAGSVLNVSGNYFPFNYSSSSKEADARAIESDWGAVGKDIEKAFLEIE